MNVNIVGKGDAAVRISKPSEASVILQQTVTSVTPSSKSPSTFKASFAGGTILTVTGFGLDSPTFTVQLGMSHTCEIVEKSYTQVTCKVCACVNFYAFFFYILI